MTNTIVVLKLVTNLVCSTNITADVKDWRRLDRENIYEVNANGEQRIIIRRHRKFEFVDGDWKLIKQMDMPLLR